MSAKEQMELDKFCGEKVMGWLTHENWWLNEEGEAERTISSWNPTTNDADAMAVLKVCAIKCTVLITGTKAGEWLVSGAGLGAEAPTLPEAIGLFSKKLHGG